MINWLRKAFYTEENIDERAFDLQISNAGDRMKAKRQLVDHKGVMELETVGKHDLYDEIQAHKDSVDINKMLERYRNGDVTALDRVKAHYIDLLDAPKNLAEMYSFVRNTASFFDTLPLDIREKYEFNVSKFVADIGSEGFKEMFTLKPEDVKKVMPVKDVSDVVENATSPEVDKNA